MFRSMSFEKQRNICSVLIAETSEMVNQLTSISSQDQFESLNYKAVKKLRELQTATSDLQLFWKVFTTIIFSLVFTTKYLYYQDIFFCEILPNESRLCEN